jgi:hypothetical protein
MANAKGGGEANSADIHASRRRRHSTEIKNGGPEAAVWVDGNKIFAGDQVGSGIEAVAAKSWSSAHIVPPVSTSPMKNRIVQNGLSHRRCMK